MLGFILSQQAFAVCTNPTAGINLTTNTVICTGTHTLDVGAGFTAIQIGASSITVTCQDGAILDGVDGQGNGIYNNGNNNVTITNCKIINFDTAIGTWNRTDDFVVEGNNIQNNTNYGIWINSNEPTLTQGIQVIDNELSSNTNYNINVFKSEDAIISDNTITGGSIGVHLDDSLGGTIENNILIDVNDMALATGGSSGSTNVTFYNNIISGGSNMAAISACNSNNNIIEFNTISDGAIGIQIQEEQYSWTAQNNIIYNMTDYAARIASDTPENPSLFINNTIYNSNYGLKITAGGIARNNIITGNTFGVYSSGPGGVTSYNNVWNNDTDYSGVAAVSSGDISEDPLFVDAVGLDFHLESGSSSIDTGHPDDEYSNEPQANGDRVNMGAYGNSSGATTTPRMLLAYADIDNGNNDWDGSNPTYIDGRTGPKASIQSCLYLVDDGGACEIADGDYPENITFPYDNIALYGAGDLALINPTSDVAITLENITDPSLSDLNISSAEYGISVTDSTNISFENLSVFENTIGLFLSGDISFDVFSNNEIIDNSYKDLVSSMSETSTLSIDCTNTVSEIELLGGTLDIEDCSPPSPPPSPEPTPDPDPEPAPEENPADNSGITLLTGGNEPNLNASGNASGETTDEDDITTLLNPKNCTLSTDGNSEILNIIWMLLLLFGLLFLSRKQPISQ